MSTQQDSAPETSAGTLDGALDVASALGRTKIEGEIPQLIPKQVQQGSDLDQAVGGRGLDGRVRLGEAAEVATEDTGSGMDDLFGSSRTGRRVVKAERAGSAAGRSEMDDLLSVSGGPRRGAGSSRSEMDDLLSVKGGGPKSSGAARSDMDDLFGVSGPRRAPQKQSRDGFDPLASSGSRGRKSAPEPSSLDDLFGPSKRR